MARIGQQEGGQQEGRQQGRQQGRQRRIWLAGAGGSWDRAHTLPLSFLL